MEPTSGRSPGRPPRLPRAPPARAVNPAASRPAPAAPAPARRPAAQPPPPPRSAKAVRKIAPRPTPASAPSGGQKKGLILGGIVAIACVTVVAGLLPSGRKPEPPPKKEETALIESKSP